MPEEPALRGVSDPQLQEAGDFVATELERLIDELGSRYPTLTVQRALFVVVVTTLGVAVKIGGPYDEQFQHFIDIVKPAVDAQSNPTSD